MPGSLYQEGTAPIVEALLHKSSAMHSHACPRQVLGIRMGLLGSRLLGIHVPQAGKDLLAVVETDGCTVDGVSVATNCWVGRRTLQVQDYGKVAASFVNARTGEAVRIAPSAASRQAAIAEGSGSRFARYMSGYMTLPDEVLFTCTPVALLTPVEKIVSSMNKRAVCSGCGEEVHNEREVLTEGAPLCRACAGDSYYTIEPGRFGPPSRKGLTGPRTAPRTDSSQGSFGSGPW
jgi:formylmethanofuran dehydrogenase subunit E